MRAGPDIVTSINTNLAELSGTWLWSTEDVYSPDYLDILNKRYNQDTLVWDEIPISVEAVTIDFLRWKANEAVIVIRKTPDPSSDVVWSGVVYTIPDDAGQGTSLVSKNVYSTGVFDSTPPTFIDNGDGTLSVGPANVNLYLNSTFTGSLDTYPVLAKLLTPTDNGQQFVVVDITSGTPEYRLENSFQAINHSNIVVIAQVWRVGNKVRWIDANSQGKGLGNKTSRALFDTTSYLVSKDGGLTVSETSTPAARTLLITSGTLYAGVVPHQIPAFNSSTDALVWSRHVAGTWTYSNTAVYDNLYYDNGTDLVAVTSGNYSVGWIYRAAGGGNETYFVKSGQQYTSFALAEADTQRNDLPYIITGYCKLLARVIIQQGASSGVVQNITSTVFQSSGSASNHNSLSGLQGGVSGQYYHFTNTEHTNLTSSLVQGIGGLSSSATGTLKYVSGTATLDTNTYLQQSDVTGVSGHIAVFIDTHTVTGDTGFTRFIYDGLTRWVRIGNGTATSDCFLALDGTPGYGKQIQFKSISSPIWILESAATTEAFTLSAYNTSEVLVDSPLVVQRAAGGAVVIGGASRPVQITSLGTGLVKAVSGTLTLATSSDIPGGPYQPLDGDLTSIAGLAGTNGLLRKTAADTWSLDTNTYLTANQSITWTAAGDVSGTASGTTSISPTLTVMAIQGKAITLATGFLKYNGTAFSFDNSSYITLASVSAAAPILYNSTTGVFSHASTDGSLHVPATGTSNNGKVLTAGATAGSLSWTTPTTGTVTSVDLVTPSLFTTTTPPVTSSGFIGFEFNNSASNIVLGDGTTKPLSELDYFAYYNSTSKIAATNTTATIDLVPGISTVYANTITSPNVINIKGSGTIKWHTLVNACVLSLQANSTNLAIIQLTGTRLLPAGLTNRDYFLDIDLDILLFDSATVIVSGNVEINDAYVKASTWIEEEIALDTTVDVALSCNAAWVNAQLNNSLVISKLIVSPLYNPITIVAPTADYDGGYANSVYTVSPIDGGTSSSTYSLPPINGGTSA